VENGNVRIVWMRSASGNTAMSRTTLLQRLTEAGYPVTLAGAGAAGAAGTPDLVLLDLEARSALVNLRADESTRETPVILLASAGADPADIEAGLAAGADDFAVDPISPTLLKSQVRDFLEIGRQRRAVREQAQRVELLKIERDVHIARQIQLDFLPKTMPEFQGWEFAARFHPAREVAGDFYDAFTLTQGRRAGLVIADVCDKGVGAALFMALTRSLIRAFAQQNYNLGWMDAKGDDLGALVGAAKRRAAPGIGTTALKSAVALTNNYITDNHLELNMFATLFFCILDPVTGSLAYVNAGHNPPVILGADGKVKATLKPTGPAVGMLEGVDFRIEQTQLEPGDLLFGYTDGVTDARDSAGSMFGAARLMDLISRPSDGATALLDNVDSTVHAHIGLADPFDDITMIAARRSADAGQRA
jgi:sigma-B regulation protein RsbU (phosphoserine phosphatase)